MHLVRLSSHTKFRSNFAPPNAPMHGRKQESGVLGLNKVTSHVQQSVQCSYTIYVFRVDATLLAHVARE